MSKFHYLFKIIKEYQMRNKVTFSRLSIETEGNILTFILEKPSANSVGY